MELDPALAVLILAGGEARRMGGAKPLRLLGGRTLLQRSLDRAQGWSDRVAIAARSKEQVGDPGVPVLLDPPGLEGPLGGLASASRLNASSVLTIPCDMPFLPLDLPAKLTASLGGHLVAVAASGGRVHPVCALWRSEALRRVGEYAATGRRSLIGFAESVGFTAVDWEGDPFFNANTQDDLAAAEARLSSER